MALTGFPSVTDDDGSFAVGTVFNKAYNDALKASIEASVFSTTNPSLSPADIIDEVVNARGSKTSLDARLDVALNEDGTLKEQSGLATKAEVSSIVGQGNWVENDDFQIWAQGDAVAPTGWTLDTVACSRETTEVKVGAQTAELVHSGSDGSLYQDILPSASMSAYGDYFQERSFTFGCWVKTSVASFARIQLDDGVTTSESSYHTGGGDWEFLSTTHTVSATGTRLRLKLQVINTSGTAYFSGACALPGSLALSEWVPCPTVYGTIAWKRAGTAIVEDDIDRFVFQRPAIIKDVQLYATTGPVGAALITEIQKYDGGWSDMYSTLPQIDDGDEAGDGGIPDGTYSHRCFEGKSGGTGTESGVDHALIRWNISQVGSGTAGATVACLVRAMVYQRPQEAFLNAGVT
jgi:hypothetical protein